MASSYDNALFQWREGERRLEGVAPGERATLQLVVDAVSAELRRRLGGPFTTDELVALYDRGTGWATDIAFRLAPDEPAAWDPRIVADAAFARYVREASDYAGGRRAGG